jgi:membrane protease YdiL (CAAX protease family)
VGLLVGVLAVSVFAAMGRRLDDQALGQLIVLMVPVGTLTTLAMALVVALARFGGEAGLRLGWRGFTPLQGVLVILLTAPLAVLSSELTNWADELLPHFDASGLGQFSRRSWVVVFLGACLLPGLGEEIFFRGFLSRGLLARHGPTLGSLLASLLFALVHVEPVQISGAFVSGIGMQYVFLTTRSLLAPIVLHVLNNTLAFAMMKHGDRFWVPGLSPPSDGVVVHTPLLLLLAAFAALLPLLVLLGQTRTRWILPGGGQWSPGYITAECPPRLLGATPVSRAPHRGLLIIALTALAGLVAAALWLHIASGG